MWPGGLFGASSSLGGCLSRPGCGVTFPSEGARTSWPHCSWSSSGTDSEDPVAGLYPLDPLVHLPHLLGDRADSRKGKQMPGGLQPQPRCSRDRSSFSDRGASSPFSPRDKEAGRWLRSRVRSRSLWNPRLSRWMPGKTRVAIGHEELNPSSTTIWL